MLEFKKLNVLEDAISTFGKKSQVDKAIEEMSELTKALCKERYTQIASDEYAEAHANVIEEIADVAIMLVQLLIIFDKDHEIQKEIDYKIDRLEQKLPIMKTLIASARTQADVSEDTPNKHTDGVKRLIDGLSRGDCKGVKGATAYKIAEYAEEMGLI